MIDELQRMQVFYVNIGGGEPTVRPDFWHLVEYAVAHDVGVKFSTNGVRLTPERARWLAASDYVDVQISLDGATAEVNDRVRGTGSYDTAITALRNVCRFVVSRCAVDPLAGHAGEFPTIGKRVASTACGVAAGLAPMEAVVIGYLPEPCRRGRTRSVRAWMG